MGRRYFRRSDVFFGLCYAVAAHRVGAAANAGRARQRRWSRTARFAWAGLVAVPFLWLLYGLLLQAAWWVAENFSPAAGIACFTLFLAAGLLQTLKQLCFAWTGDAE
jgi:hypothetical protein